MQDIGMEYNTPTLGLYFMYPDYIEFLQHLEYYLKEAKIEFVEHSKYPLVMIEALQSSLPCVCFAVNGVRGTIRNGENGYIVEEKTAGALADAILKMIGSQDKIPAMAQRAMESAKAFEKERVMAKWTSLFEELTKHIKPTSRQQGRSGR